MNDSRVADIGKASGRSTLSKEIMAVVLVDLQPGSSYPDRKAVEQ